MNRIFSLHLSIPVQGFPGGSDGKESAGNTGDWGSIPGSGRIPWRREWLPILVFLLGEFQGQRSLVGFKESPMGTGIHGGCKESEMTE